MIISKTGKILFYFQAIQRLIEGDETQNLNGFKVHLGSWYNKGKDFEKKVKNHFKKKDVDFDLYDEETYIMFDLMDEIIQLNYDQKKHLIGVLKKTNNKKDTKKLVQ